MSFELVLFGLGGLIVLGRILSGGKTDEPPIILGIHDTDERTIKWISKPPKTWQDDLQELATAWLVGFIFGVVITVILIW